MINNHNPIPHFDNEDDERAFWATHDSIEFIDWSKAEKNPVFPILKPSTGDDQSSHLPPRLHAE